MNVDVEALIREAGTAGPGRIRAAARLMTIAEGGSGAAVNVLGKLAGAPEPRLVLGLTGSPGSGKSSLVDRLLQHCRAENPDSHIGVIAVDPSSPYSNGAFLGDRVRMMRHAGDPNIFIRSAATRGHIGGLAAGVFGMLKVMGLAGCDMVLIETVGVGQMEIEIESLADLVLIVLAPGQGDAMQFQKAGLMEAGDVFVVNKGDCAGAAEFHAQLMASLRLIDHDRKQRGPDAVRLVSAREDHGIAELLDYLERLRDTEAARWLARRRTRLGTHLRAAVLELAQRRLEAEWSGLAESDPVERVLRGETALADLAGELLRRAVLDNT
ncbi:methylmalonyl Co-A mutase-associated GTPase MeaB [Methylolobus aquaticus]|nr:methylmalonyl Co-A mutase-associated GTPase MeaB [Methylolobus aquaticus]